MKQNPTNIQLVLDWLKKVIDNRLDVHLGRAKEFVAYPLEFYNEDSGLAKFIATYQPSFEELVLFMMALTPHLKPDYFGQIVSKHFPEGGDFPEFGGVKGTNHRGILPTGETAQFILAGNDLEGRIEVQRILSSEHWFAKKRILWLEPVREGEPVMSGRLILDPEIVELLTTGTVSRPRFSTDFPAEYIETEMEWGDLVLHPNTLLQIREIENWITHNDTLLHEWGMKKKIKPGYRALFYGPPGTGKTLTATLLGKYTDKDVFRVDLSRVVSKYIGETEKNLSRLFDKAENKDWILFFDEADALFGKRTDIRDAHDKYANQEAAYLLQRIEGYDGLVILATNQRGNIDDAFVRRFQNIIHFPMPRPEERYEIWRRAFPPQIKIGEEIDWRQVSARFELAGASIMNVTQYCSLEALADKSGVVGLKRLESAIMREYIKEGKVI
ncbi:MAG: ATP-binding protein [Planctomycetia bacterium]|nr:MAG: ATP-binding protein [Planctomycetia bacterium]TVL96162.1 MAG: AAA family ATPase [Candidatus Brocadia sp. BL1]HQU31014.1 ATP-binding protein [Candidatus Brocadia sapporoensis]